MRKIQGEVFIQSNRKIYAPKVLAMEMWLNNQIAGLAFQKFGIGLRIHLRIPEQDAQKDPITFLKQ